MPAWPASILTRLRRGRDIPPGGTTLGAKPVARSEGTVLDLGYVLPEGYDAP